MNESTVHYIKKDEVNIRKMSAITFNKSEKRVVMARNKTIIRMEAALAVWIADCQKKNIALDTNIIQTKTRSLYKTFAAKESEDDSGDHEEDEDDVEDQQPGTSSDSQPKKHPFSASKGWFVKFQKHFGLKSVSLHGEAASADKSATETYVNETFKKIISEGGYKPEQVFNMDKMSLFWKRMLSQTFLFKDESKASGFKVYKDYVTLVMCGNAAGFLLKPGINYKSKNPRALKNKNKNLLPIHWMHDPKAWITKMLTFDWFHQCFIMQVKVYLLEKGLPFEILLMDNSGGHTTDLSHEGIQTEYLLPNTTSLIQPVDQGVIRVFKALYTRNVLVKLVASVDAPKKMKTKILT
ncbi:tigger transposable element-derived protein 1-like [Octopus sinensis]|uniref:Tigger transposable element-derived protein 1-like n=1 Tax=Octopus sinensis TaxID=2607531 RepID=A0A6P7SR46_9MOLL|nr:tigger transposable element-derived protein 1-like [Octopus sinensis]